MARYAVSGEGVLQAFAGLGQARSAKRQREIAEEERQRQERQARLSSLFALAGAGAGFAMGGPSGAAAGLNIGGVVGSAAGGQPMRPEQIAQAGLSAYGLYSDAKAKAGNTDVNRATIGLARDSLIAQQQKLQEYVQSGQTAGAGDPVSPLLNTINSRIDTLNKLEQSGNLGSILPASIVALTTKLVPGQRDPITLGPNAGAYDPATGRQIAKNTVTTADQLYTVLSADGTKRISPITFEQLSEAKRSAGDNARVYKLREEPPPPGPSVVSATPKDMWDVGLDPTRYSAQKDSNGLLRNITDTSRGQDSPADMMRYITGVSVKRLNGETIAPEVAGVEQQFRQRLSLGYKDAAGNYVEGQRYGYNTPGSFDDALLKQWRETHPQQEPNLTLPPAIPSRDAGKPVSEAERSAVTQRLLGRQYLDVMEANLGRTGRIAGLISEGGAWLGIDKNSIEFNKAADAYRLGLRGTLRGQGQISDQEQGLLDALVPKLTDPEEVVKTKLRIGKTALDYADKGEIDYLRKNGMSIPPQLEQSAAAAAARGGPALGTSQNPHYPSGPQEFSQYRNGEVYMWLDPKSKRMKPYVWQGAQ